MVQMVTRETASSWLRGEVLDVVELGELAAGVGRDELVELAHGLLAEIGAVHEEQDALGPGVLDQAVGEAAGGVGLARAGGHLDERAGMVGGEGLLPDAVMPSIWQSRMPFLRGSGCAVGIAASRARRVSGSASHAASVSGRWKEKTRRERGSGSRSSRKKVSTPVDS